MLCKIVQIIELVVNDDTVNQYEEGNDLLQNLKNMFLYCKLVLYL